MTRINAWTRDLPARLNALQGELNRLFEHYRPPHLPPGGPPSGEPAWAPAIDLYEMPEAFILEADVPGIDPEAIELTLDGNVLTLHGRCAPAGPTGATEHTAERPIGAFTRQVPLAGEVDAEAVQADARDGVLRVRLPKAGASRVRTIPVRTP